MPGKRFVDEDPREVTRDPNRYAMVAQAKTGRWAIVVRATPDGKWVQVASRSEWPVSRDEAWEYENNPRLRQLAIDRNGAKLDDWGDDRFVKANAAEAAEAVSKLIIPVRAPPIARALDFDFERAEKEPYLGYDPGALYRGGSLPGSAFRDPGKLLSLAKMYGMGAERLSTMYGVGSAKPMHFSEPIGHFIEPQLSQVLSEPSAPRPRIAFVDPPLVLQGSHPARPACAPPDEMPALVREIIERSIRSCTANMAALHRLRPGVYHFDIEIEVF